MEPLPDWAPADVDLTTASAARMYDYYLGGAHNFGIDREMAAKALAVYPDGRLIAQANRAFLHRAVRYLVGAGVRQFIDLGAGIPTAGSVHETAAAEGVEGVRVLYVDHDPVAVAHSELILGDRPDVRVLRGDLRHPEPILDSPELAQVIDLSRPVGVLMLAVMHFIPEDEQPGELIARFRERVAGGSYLVMSHAASDTRQNEAGKVIALYRSSADPLTYRSRQQVRDLFTGWDLVEPGVVWGPQWHPDWPDEVGAEPSRMGFAAAVGRKP